MGLKTSDYNIEQTGDDDISFAMANGRVVEIYDI